ncbi:MAG TPA: 5-demethoxyubiquinol-8 5-hydroxylase UbiM, partial [Steroidobacteraceae bacterium]|nr:5-demethoxyubiquinol-8 5-hydroxylase UbiM [Steroidobacteraceae bacterium]
MSDSPSEYDIVIIGAGPAGLCFAGSLRDTTLRIAIVERLDAIRLADPPYDGREIALTHGSARLLRELAIWQHLPAEGVSTLRSARVLNGNATEGLELTPGHGALGQLGYLVSNHLIRRAAYDVVREQPGVTVLAHTAVTALHTDQNAGYVTLSDGRSLEARLIVAADSRFSETRRAMGVAARHHDFGRTMLVCCMQHEIPHGHVAVEWFGHRQTLALLPMNGDRSSVVLTLPHAEIERLRRLPAGRFEQDMQRRLLGRLGRMTLAGERFAYPLVAVYPERFTTTRYAVIGDAAVGMHPVTAHGFNFGLRSQDTLARLISAAWHDGRDIGAAPLLRAYDSEHRRAT